MGNRIPRVRLDSILWRLFGPRGPLRRFASSLEPFLRQRQRQRWDSDWQAESQRPAPFLSNIVPQELIEAVENGWFPPASSVIDIGSGRGQISAWLAERGFRVLGADLSPRATALAQRDFQQFAERLEFRTMDVCASAPISEQFDCLVDRGCFHIVPDLLLPQYATNVGHWAKFGSPFLLYSRQGQVRRVQELLNASFEIIRTLDAPYVRSAGELPRKSAPGTVFWMVRRGPV